MDSNNPNIKSFEKLMEDGLKIKKEPKIKEKNAQVLEYIKSLKERKGKIIKSESLQYLKSYIHDKFNKEDSVQLLDYSIILSEFISQYYGGQFKFNMK